MNRRSNTIPIVAMAGACLVLVIASTWALGVGPFGSGDDPGPIIATVDGQPIYLSEAQSRIEGLAATHGASASPLSSSDWPDTVLQSLVDDKIVQAEAERLGITVSDKDIADEVLNIQGMFPSAEEFQTWLRSQQMTLDELERRIELQMLTVRVYNGVTADVDVSAEALRAYYDANPTLYSTTQVAASHILVKDEETAKQIRAELEQHPDRFAALAMEKSTDTGSAKKGGELGLFGHHRRAVRGEVTVPVDAVVDEPPPKPVAQPRRQTAPERQLHQADGVENVVISPERLERIQQPFERLRPQAIVIDAEPPGP